MKKVQQFYNKIPFPDYELNRFTSKEILRISASKFAKTLDRSIPDDASIIDIGTGTGQLSAYLSLRRKCVWGIDFSDSSLKKATALKKQLNLSSLNLKKIDILDKKQIKDIGMKFDYVLCFGVLHHTSNAYKGFENILHLLKPYGKIAIGLYNRYGRIPLKIRILLVKTIFSKNQKVKDSFIKLQIGDINDKEKARGWWNDQYFHPHETTHTVDEVLGWFKNNNIEYMQSVPSLNISDQSDLDIAGVWNGFDEKYPNLLTRIYKQFLWLWETHREGGYWITFGSKTK